MKQFLIITLLLCCKLSFAQAYKYYFIEVRATPKSDVITMPENQTLYPDIDSLVCERSVNDKGKEVVKEKKYRTYSEVFNKLSASGLEFYHFANIPKVGGAVEFISNSTNSTYMVWRKKIQ
jgi:hypothetical protein